MMQDKELGFIERCAHCGKAKNMHRAYTLCCPTGKRGPTGYTTFGPRTFTPPAARVPTAAGPSQPDVPNGKPR
jgi:hypothetical protein